MSKPLRIKRADLPKQLRKKMPKGPNKYNAQPQKREGRTVASSAEARRLAELRLWERAGRISNLELQPRFFLDVNCRRCGEYVADFQYLDNVKGHLVVEDVKGVRTAVFKLKRALVEAIYGIRILETGGNKDEKAKAPHRWRGARRLRSSRGAQDGGRRKP